MVHTDSHSSTDVTGHDIGTTQFGRGRTDGQWQNTVFFTSHFSDPVHAIVGG